MRVKQIIAEKVLWLFGWKVEGDRIQTAKGIFVVVPHTHWEDFPLGLMVRQYLGLDVKFIAKKSLFKGIKGSIFRWLGGYPVDRDRRQGFVQAVADIFNQHDRFYIAIAPEGTRKKVDRLKSGFYYIALEAEVPLYLTAFDFEHKRVRIKGPVWAENGKLDQVRSIEEHFRGVLGRVPEYSF